jgi:hypothetical protein
MQPSPLHEMERMDEMDEMERTLRGLDQSEDGSGNCAFGSWREEARFLSLPDGAGHWRTFPIYKWTDQRMDTVTQA